MHLNKEVYKAAIYLRISRDDEDKSESDSKHKIERPGDKTPVEKREHTRPFRD